MATTRRRRPTTLARRKAAKPTTATKPLAINYAAYLDEQPRRWVLNFEGALPPNVNERERMHWRARAKLIKSWREAAEVAARAARIPTLKRISVSFTVKRARLGVADRSGDSERGKPIIDGFCDAKIVCDDTYKHVTVIGCEEERGPRAFVVEILEVA